MVDNIDIAIYADDNTPYSVAKSQCDLETKLQKASVKLFKQFHENDLVYNDFSSSFSELLEKDKSVTIHHCNLQTLAYEIFKVKKNMTSEILTEIFPQKESNYSVKNSTTLQGRNIKTVMCGSETLSSLGPKLWDILPMELKIIVSPTLFKKKILEWVPKN